MNNTWLHRNLINTLNLTKDSKERAALSLSRDVRVKEMRNVQILRILFTIKKSLELNKFIASVSS